MREPPASADWTASAALCRGRSAATNDVYRGVHFAKSAIVACIELGDQGDSLIRSSQHRVVERPAVKGPHLLRLASPIRDFDKRPSALRLGIPSGEEGWPLGRALSLAVRKGRTLLSPP